MQKNNPSNAELYYMLGEIKGLLSGIVEMQTKTIYALIALAGATVGLRLFGSPPIQIIMFYVKTFIFLFTALLALGKRSSLKSWYYMFGFGLSAGLAQILKLVTPTETTLSTILFLISNISLLLFVWKWGDGLPSEPQGVDE